MDSNKKSILVTVAIIILIILLLLVLLFFALRGKAGKSSGGDIVVVDSISEAVVTENDSDNAPQARDYVASFGNEVEPQTVLTGDVDNDLPSFDAVSEKVPQILGEETDGVTTVLDSEVSVTATGTDGVAISSFAVMDDEAAKTPDEDFTESADSSYEPLKEPESDSSKESGMEAVEYGNNSKTVCVEYVPYQTVEPVYSVAGTDEAVAEGKLSMVYEPDKNTQVVSYSETGNEAVEDSKYVNYTFRYRFEQPSEDERSETVMPVATEEASDRDGMVASDEKAENEVEETPSEDEGVAEVSVSADESLSIEESAEDVDERWFDVVFALDAGMVWRLNPPVGGLGYSIRFNIGLGLVNLYELTENMGLGLWADWFLILDTDRPFADMFRFDNCIKGSGFDSLLTFNYTHETERLIVGLGPDFRFYNDTGNALSAGNLILGGRTYGYDYNLVIMSLYNHSFSELMAFGCSLRYFISLTSGTQELCGTVGLTFTF